MFFSTPFLYRFLLLGVLFNAPPLLLMLFATLQLESVLLVASTMIWVNVPLMSGLESLFADTSVTYAEFGAIEASWGVLAGIILFWCLCAGVIAKLWLWLRPSEHGHNE